MKKLSKVLIIVGSVVFLSSCVLKKEYLALETQLLNNKNDLAKARESLNSCKSDLSDCKSELSGLKAAKSVTSETCDQRIADLKEQISDLKSQRDEQTKNATGLVEMSTTASENMKQTLDNLAKKEKYIYLLQSAKTKADSINLALSANLKVALKDGIEDEDVDVKVDKTVVFINLSDKMLYNSGSANITSRANEVLAKIAAIIKSKPDVEVMVEGYTDSDPIKPSKNLKDNWDLSVLRSTSVVRALQDEHGVDPNKLIAAGRGQYNALASNDTPEGKSINRRTRIIILPKLDQFYDLLKPAEE